MSSGCFLDLVTHEAYRSAAGVTIQRPDRKERPEAVPSASRSGTEESVIQGTRSRLPRRLKRCFHRNLVSLSLRNHSRPGPAGQPVVLDHSRDHLCDHWGCRLRHLSQHQGQSQRSPRITCLATPASNASPTKPTSPSIS